MIKNMKKLSRRSFLQKAGIATGVSTAAISMSLHGKPVEQIRKIYDGRKLNIALCGLGRYAGYIAIGLEEARYCRLAGIVTGTPAKAEDWKKKYSIPPSNVYNYENFDSIN